MANIAVKVEMMDEKCKELKSLGRSRSAGRRAALEAAEGLTNKEATAATAGKRRRRFAERRLDGHRDEPRPGAPPAGACAPCPERQAMGPPNPESASA